jgi:hypothetical protein
MDQYRFLWSPESLIAPIRHSNGLASVIPDWPLLQEEGLEPNIAQKVEPIDEPHGKRLGLICHAYNISPSFLRWIERVIVDCEPSAVVFTTDTTTKQAQLESYLDSMPSTLRFSKVLVCANIGRDVVPFWHALKEISTHADVFLKLHWKLSPHLDQFFPKSSGLQAGEAWNEDLYRTLIPKKRSDIDDLLSLFSTRQVACVYPRPWPPVAHIHWYSESTLIHCSELMSGLSCHQSALLLPLIYPVGNMFYGSVAFFERFIDYFLGLNSYPSEPIPEDGTVFHAIERIYTLLAACSGYDVATLFPSSAANSDDETGGDPAEARRLVIFPVAALLASSMSGTTSSSPEFTLPVLHQIVMAKSMRNRILAQRRIDQQRLLNRLRSGLSKVKAWLFRGLDVRP